MSWPGYFLRRIKSRWQMLVLLFLSVGLAAGLLASGPVLADTVMGFALPHKLRSSAPLSSNLRLTIYQNLDAAGYQALDAQMQTWLQERLGEYTRQVIGGGSSNTLIPWYLEQMLTDQRINLRFYTGMEPKIEWVAGGWPEQPMQGEVVVNAAVSELFASTYGLEIGDRLPLSRSEREAGPSLWLEVSGILRAEDAQDPYWFGEFSPLTLQADEHESTVLSAILSPEAFLTVQQALFPNARPELIWNVQLDPATVQVADIPELRSQLAILRTEAAQRSPAVALETHLDATLDSFTRQAWVVRITMYVLIAEILFLALYYLSMVASLSVQQVEGEFANLSSRGGSFSQIFRLQVAEAGVVCLVALLVGPGLALGVVWVLAKSGPIAQVSLADWQPGLAGSAWLAAGIGALVGLAGLLLPVRQAVQHSVVTHIREKSRPERTQWWQRAYLDVLAALAASVLVWRLRSYGGLAGISGQVDWLLLVAPLALLVSFAVILLRIFPWLLRGLNVLAAAWRGLPAVLGLWYATRNPTHMARLILLLTLTMALGILSTGLEITLNSIEYERAVYAAGADLRLTFDRYRSPAAMENENGVLAASAVWRGAGMVNIRSYRDYPRFELLAVEPLSFSQVSRYREDYADQPMGQLLGELIVEADPGANPLLELEGQPGSIGVWLLDHNALYNETRLIDTIHLQAKVLSAQGETFLVNFSATPPTSRAEDDPAPEEEWRYLEAELPAYQPEDYPLSLHSIWINIRPAAYEQAMLLNFALDDISVVDLHSGASSIMEDFEVPQRIWQVSDNQVVAQFTRQVQAHSGSGTLFFRLPTGRETRGFSLYLSGSLQREMLPVLASPEFLLAIQLKVGDHFLAYVQSNAIPMIIQGEVRYFPTLYETANRGFLVTARDPLLTMLNRNLRMPANANEIWVGVEPGQAPDQMSRQFTQAVRSIDRAGEQRAIQADPLTLGLRSVVLLGTILTAVLSLAGFSAHFTLTVRQRETAYSILRSLGLSTGQLYGALLLEQLLMICAGLALGTVLGLVLNQLVLPSLPLTLGDRPAVPPLLPLENWSGVISFYVILVISFLAILGGATAVLWRANIHRLMRIGQD